MPLPCDRCDHFIAGRSSATQKHWTTVRWFLDDRATADGQPHQHLGDTVLADLEACDAALRREVAAVQEAYRLQGEMHALLATVLADAEEQVDEAIERLIRAGDISTVQRVDDLAEQIHALEKSRTWFLAPPDG